MTKNNQEQLTNSMIELKENLAELSNTLPALRRDKLLRCGFSIATSIVVAIYLTVIFIYFFSVNPFASVFISVTTALALATFDLFYLAERFRTGQRGGASFWWRAILVMTLLIAIGFLGAATKLDSSSEFYLNEQKIEYTKNQRKSPEYVSLIKKRQKLEEQRSEMTNEALKVEKKVNLLKKAIEQGAVQLIAERDGVEFEDPETGIVTSGTPNNPNKPEVNTNYNRILAVQNTNKATYSSAQNRFSTLSKNLDETSKEVTALNKRIDDFEKTVDNEVEIKFDTVALTKMGAFISLLTTDNSRQAEAWITTGFLLLISIFFDLVQCTLLFTKSRLDEVHALFEETTIRTLIASAIATAENTTAQFPTSKNNVRILPVSRTTSFKSESLAPTDRNAASDNE